METDPSQLLNWKLSINPIRFINQHRAGCQTVQMEEEMPESLTGHSPDVSKDECAADEFSDCIPEKLESASISYLSCKTGDFLGQGTRDKNWKCWTIFVPFWAARGHGYSPVCAMLHATECHLHGRTTFDPQKNPIAKQSRSSITCTLCFRRLTMGNENAQAKYSYDGSWHKPKFCGPKDIQIVVGFWMLLSHICSVRCT